MGSYDNNSLHYPRLSNLQRGEVSPLARELSNSNRFNKMRTFYSLNQSIDGITIKSPSGGFLP